jgi:hypothetical protein
MRPVDEVTRLWNDTRLRMSQGRPSLASWSPAAWSWPLVTAVGAAMVTLIATSSSDVPAGSNTNVAAAPVALQATCQDQTWPYLSDDCLRRDQAARARAAEVRVIQHQPAMAAAAIGARPWAPKATLPSRQPQSRHKQATHDGDPSRTVTDRSGRKGRNAAPERIYVVPGDSAYRAFGSGAR